MKRKRFVVIMLVCIVLYIILNPRKEIMNIEDLDIPAGLGFDTEQNSKGDIYYSIPTSFYVFTPQDKTIVKLHIGKGITIGRTREERQLRENNKFILGLEKVVIISEKASRLGIRKILDVLNRNFQINDMAQILISEQTAEEVLNLKIEGYASSSDYIEGMTKRSYQQNFFSDNYKLIDMYVLVDTEGSILVLPYLSIKKGRPVISAMAIFNSDKMTEKVSIEQAKAMNIMRENQAKGILSLFKDINTNVDFIAKTQRKVKCSKAGDKYKFDIDIKVSGDIIANSMYENIEKDPLIIKKFEKDMTEHLESLCYQFLDKMQNQYRLDCLGLGAAAAARYGRDTGVNWNEVVSDADIRVNVKVRIDKVGRGEY